VEHIRKSSWIKHFPGGEGNNNCPRFYYIRDGFGCTFTCKYCYLERHGFRHEGAEFDPAFDALYHDVKSWLRKPGSLGLILGEVTDAWGWAHMVGAHEGDVETVRERNVQLINMFREQQRHTLIFLTKDARVHRHLEGIPPTDRVVLSWSVNAPEVAEHYEMGAKQAEARLRDARICREQGWRVRVRLDPMIPVPRWQEVYTRLAETVARDIQPEQVTCGSWRPRSRDEMYKNAVDFRTVMEMGPDGRLRIKNRLEMYELVWSVLDGCVPELSLCKEELDVQEALYSKFGVREQACNCLGRPTKPVGLVPESSLVRRRDDGVDQYASHNGRAPQITVV
jgi:DNA repair photolyase